MANENKYLKKDRWWHDTGLRFECVECGNCCGGEPGFIWLNDEEAAKISEHLDMDETEFRKQYLIQFMGRQSIIEKENYDCVFLDEETRKCKIYSVRPMQCRTYPFWSSLLEDKRLWDYYSKRCPGMGKGKLYSPEEIIQINSSEDKTKS